MPELPEVETVCQELDKCLTGEVVAEAVALRREIRKGCLIPADFESVLKGAKLAGVQRRAKYIFIRLEGGVDIYVHLGMTGRLSFFARAEFARYTLQKHDHIVWQMKSGAALVFSDIRRFGQVGLCPCQDEEKICGGGVEPLSSAFTPAFLLASFKGCKSPVKTALLDQRKIVGLGNIYVCEALFRAGISPFVSAQELTLAQAEKLVPIIRESLAASIKAGGTTFRNYRKADGTKGEFAHFLLVYGKAGENCPQCGHKIARVAIGGRGTFFCPVCQKGELKNEKKG